MMTAHEILEKARAAGQRLPYNEAAVLFSAAVRLAAASDSTLRGRLLRIDEAGGLHLDTFDEDTPEAEPAYLAPELLTPDAPDKTDPKVQVYAAGVLGYELLTGKLAPPPGQAAGPELSGDLGEVVRRALSVDRRVRIEDLRELQEAVEAVQPRPPAEGERNILSALRNRFSRPPPEKEALAKVIDRLHQLETQIAQLGKAQARLEAAQRESLEAIDRFETGQHRTVSGQRRPSVLGPALFGGVLASAAVIAGAWALGLLGVPGLTRPPATASTPTEPAAPAQPPPPAPEPATPDAAVAAAEPTSAQIDAGAAPAAAAPGDAGDADASDALAVHDDGVATLHCGPAFGSGCERQTGQAGAGESEDRGEDDVEEECRKGEPEQRDNCACQRSHQKSDKHSQHPDNDRHLGSARGCGYSRADDTTDPRCDPRDCGEQTDLKVGPIA